jgi:hypothetical protein
MKRFIPAESRSQTTLLPESLDDYIDDLRRYCSQVRSGRINMSALTPNPSLARSANGRTLSSNVE